MKRILYQITVIGWILLLLPVMAGAQNPGDIIPGRFVVTFRAEVSDPQQLARQLAQAHGFQVRHVYQHALQGMAIELPAQAGASVLNALRRNPQIRTVGHDRYIGIAAQIVPKGIDRINAEPGMGANTGSGIRVAIFDTGLDFNHADLKGNIETALSVTCIEEGKGCSGSGQDDNGHGTFVGGIVAAIHNTQNVVGVSPEVKLIAIKVLDSTGNGSFGNVIAGVDYLMGLAGGPIEVANMSLSARCSVCTDNSSDPGVAAFHEAIRRLVNAGTTVVVAAGNDGGDTVFNVPASFDEVITVSALADSDGKPGGTGPSTLVIGMGQVKDDTFAKFSNYGADIDVIAPGFNETSLKLSGGTSTGIGTSYAAPHAAGVAAIFIHNQGESLPNPGIVRQALIQTGECHEGSGTIFHGADGCGQVWPGDPDGIPEPLVRADNTVSFSLAVVHDVAITSINVPSPVEINAEQSVTVGVANQGTQGETFTVTLDDDHTAIIDPSEQSVALAAGASATLSFSWTPTVTGDHLLTATATTVSNETKTDNNSKPVTSTVTEPGSSDGSISLTATGYKVKGIQHADLEWSGPTSENVDIIRNGSGSTKITTVKNTGSYTDNIGQKGGGSYTYQVCEAGTSTCSNEATVNF